MRFQLSWAVVIALLLVSIPAVGSKTDKAAKDAFDKAVKLYRQGAYEKAASEFRRANELKPTFQLLYNIGQSEAAAKNYGLAYEAFEEYVSRGGDDIEFKRREEVLAEIERLSKMIGSLQVSAPPGCILFVDGKKRGITPLPGKIKISAGIVHRVEIKKDGEVIRSTDVKVSFGEVHVEKLEQDVGEAHVVKQKQTNGEKREQTAPKKPSAWWKSD